MAVGFLTNYLPPGADITTVNFLPFLSTFLRERCTRLSSDEEEEVEAYIIEQQSLAKEHRDRPWVLEENFEDNPLLAENTYIQQYVPFSATVCHDRSLMGF